uniref:GLPGLI family protein n=2 Tax=Flavobacterium sp. TaxID=239 RepID=UPI0040493128
MKTKVAFFIFFTLKISAQNLVIEYEHLLFDTKDEFGVSWKLTEKVVTNKNFSCHYVRSIDTVFYNPNTKSSFYNEGSNDFVISNFKDINKKINFSGCIFNKYNVADSVYSINWTILKNQKKILGYDCQSAKGRYRGRDYIVYFSSKLPYQNGPDRFDGLPGLILEVKSDDGCVNYIAKSIYSNNELLISNPFLDKPLISWSTFSKNYKKMFYKTLNNQTDENTTIHINNRTIEYLFED